MNCEKGISELALKFKKFILDTIFPIECLGCGREGVWLCEECLGKIGVDKHSLGGESLEKILTFYSYDNEILKKAIHFLKYRFVEDLALPLGNLLANGVNAESRRPEKDFILMPVPLYKKRLLGRGFNQAALLARGLSDRFGLEIEEKVLERVRQTVPQVDLEEKERKDNVKNVFSVRDILRVKNKKIILVDDVITTGATIEECGKVLKLSGAKEVWGVALAKG
jgi:ComF family protein